MGQEVLNPRQLNFVKVENPENTQCLAEPAPVRDQCCDGAGDVDVESAPMGCGGDHCVDLECVPMPDQGCDGVGDVSNKEQVAGAGTDEVPPAQVVEGTQNVEPPSKRHRSKGPDLDRPMRTTPLSPPTPPSAMEVDQVEGLVCPLKQLRLLDPMSLRTHFVWRHLST